MSRVRGEETKESTVGGGGEGGRVRVRVIFQNPNPKTLFDVLDIVSAVRTPPEARARVRVRVNLG